jgi:hypothetical protein
MENNLINNFKYIQDSEHKIWFTIEEIENTIHKHNSEINSDSLIMDYLESNCLELCKDKTITTRAKLDGNSTETLYNVLEGFLEYLKYHI